MILRFALAALVAGTSLQIVAAELPHITADRAQATSFLAISPIFSQLVAFKMPLDFHVAYEHTSAHAYIREAVLQGETVDQWSQMITVTGYRDVAASPGPPPAVLLNTLADGFSKHCPATITVGDLGNSPIDGYPAALAFLACGTVNEGEHAHSEAAVVLAIKGAQDYYTIQWAERGPAQAARVAFDKTRWVARLEQLMPVFLCAKVAGEKAPYPSCVSRLPRDEISDGTTDANAQATSTSTSLSR
jgi:hypothetical protein